MEKVGNSGHTEDVDSVGYSATILVDSSVEGSNDCGCPRTQERRGVEDRNVSFEKERLYFETSRDSIRDRIAALQVELGEELRLSKHLAHKRLIDSDDIEVMADFMSGNEKEITSLHATAVTLNAALRAVILSNKTKQKELAEGNAAYMAFISSPIAVELAARIKEMRTLVGRLEHFLVEQGLKGAGSPKIATM